MCVSCHVGTWIFSYAMHCTFSVLFLCECSFFFFCKKKSISRSRRQFSLPVWLKMEVKCKLEKRNDDDKKVSTRLESFLMESSCVCILIHTRLAIIELLSHLTIFNDATIFQFVKLWLFFFFFSRTIQSRQKKIIYNLYKIYSTLK